MHLIFFSYYLTSEVALLKKNFYDFYAKFNIKSLLESTTTLLSIITYLEGDPK